ncbi:MAG TPA: cytochrome c [Usitatibacter sp.]|jgi:cytochrome c553|nr:cytochrome c [Usitatibacter sp.]
MKPAMLKVLAAAALCAALPAFAASGNAEAGAKKSVPCQACHGPKGISVSPEFPNLAGQHADYLAAALHHYKNGKRKNPIMQGQVANLTERDILDLAAYFSGEEGLYTKE